ncbi:peptidase M48, partial [Pseudomonas syringae]
MVSLARLQESERGRGVVVVRGGFRMGLARAVIAWCLLWALVGGIGLAGLNWAGARARQSRERLLHTFSRVRRVLPFVLVGHMVSMGAAVSAILRFEALGLWHGGRISAGELKLILVVLVLVAAGPYSLWRLGT